MRNILMNKKDGYRQRNVRQFLQSAWGTLFRYLTRVTPVCRCLQPFLRLQAFGYTSTESNAAFTPAQQVARNLMLVARNKLRVAHNTQLVAGNKQLAARNMMLVARNKLRWCKRGIRHILASSGTIAVIVAWVERWFNACQTHRIRSMYPSIFIRFPLIQPESSKVRHFSTLFAHFGLPYVQHWDNRGNAVGKGIMLVKRLAASIFNHFWDVASYWSKIAIFSYLTSV